MKLRVKVTPNARQNEIIGWFGDRLKIKIAARPAKGEANCELVKFLAKELSIAKLQISVLHGHTSSNKVLEVEGIEKGDLESQLGVVRVQESLFSPSVRGG